MNLVIIGAYNPERLADLLPILTAQFVLGKSSAVVLDAAYAPWLATAVQSEGVKPEAIKVISAGCLCCASGPLLKTTVAQLIRTQQPKTLWIVGGPSAKLSGIADAMVSPFLDPYIQLQSIVWLGQPQSAPTSPKPNWILAQQEAASDWWDTHWFNWRASESLALALSRQLVFDRLNLFKQLALIPAPAGCIADLRTPRAWYRATCVQGVWQWSESQWRLNNRVLFSANTDELIKQQIQLALTRSEIGFLNRQ